MKRSMKLLVLLAVLLLLAGGTFIVTTINSNPATGSDNTEDSGITILSLDSSDITSITLTHEGETLTFNQVDGNWLVVGEEDFPLIQNYLKAMAYDLKNLVATKTIENPEDLSQFGLDNPVCSVTITEKSTTELLIGEANTLGGSRYISIGDGNVYLTDHIIYTDFAKTRSDLMEKEKIPTMDNPLGIEVVTADREYRIEKEQQGNNWYHYEDGNQIALYSELTTTFLSSITDMTWNSCINYKATEEELESYGLASPAAIVTLTYESSSTDEGGNTTTSQESFTLEIGNTAEEDSCYARLPGSNMVYLINDSIRTSMLEKTADDLQVAGAEA